MEGVPLRKQPGVYSETLKHAKVVELQGEVAIGPSSRLATNPVQRLPRVKPLTRKKGAEEADVSMQSVNSSGIYSRKRPGVANIPPKVFEPYALVEGRAPRKVVIDRQEKLFASLRIEDLLTQEGVDYSVPAKSWLPLEPFDLEDYNVRNNEEWIDLGKDSGGEYNSVPGVGLFRDPANPLTGTWKPVIIHAYDTGKKVFSGNWDDQIMAPCQLSKINLLFRGEDPYRFAKRVAAAQRERQLAEDLIKYNFYIDNMPTDEIPTLDSDQKARLLNKATCIPLLERKYNPENSPIILEITLDFARTMNKIIFDKYIEESDKEIIQVDLSLPREEEVPAPQFGMVQIPQHDFPEQFSNFCFNSLYIKDEVISSMEQIRSQCRQATELDIFHTVFDKTMRPDEFRLFQTGAQTQLTSSLKSWRDAIQAIITGSFSSIGKGWFNMHETSKETYEFGKLKKYLTTVKLMMQDALATLAIRSLHKFVDAIEASIPIVVTVKTPLEIENVFKPDPSQSEEEQLRKPALIPLFAISIMLKHDSQEFCYSTDLKKIGERLVTIFNDGLEKLGVIPTMEELVLEHLLKKQGKQTFLKTPVVPIDLQPPPTLEEKRKGKLPNENTWVWELRCRLSALADKAVEPLQTYLKVYDQYSELVNLNIEEYVTKVEHADPEKTVEELRDLIYEHQQKEQQLLREVPEVVVVSCFEVTCKDVRVWLSGKHASIVKMLTELIAHQVRTMNANLSEYFRELNKKLNRPPKDIDELTALMELMAQVPTEIEKKMIEIDEYLSKYRILEKFNYKFSTDDMERRWAVYGSPKKIMELIDLKQDDLEKNKAVFKEQMVEEQTEFREAIQDLENIVRSFAQYTDISQYDEVAGMVLSVNERLDKCVAEARKFNHREGLFSMEISDYSAVFQSVKDFKPYSDLWLTIQKWENRHTHWMNDEWDTLKGEEIEEVVDSSVKTISTVSRYFKGRDLPQIANIVDKQKAKVDDFRQYVRLAVALLKPGMADRHWKQISDKMNLDVEIKPKEGFTLTTVIELGLKKHEEFCEEVGERAYKEFQIETNLNKMEAAWENVDFSVLPAKGTDTWILGGFDKVQNLLDEHIVQSQAMQLSNFKKPFEARIEEWVKTLMLIQDIIEEWAKCQVSWMYLSPIFDSKDIAKQLPGESKKFKSVDGTWRHTMTQVKQTANVIKTCKKEGRLDALREANRNLEVVQKGLNDYLETKRAAFARFYFLSNDELLSILSETKDPTRVQPHLRKVFENMSKLEFHDDTTIHSMFSAEDEQVQWVTPVDPRDKYVEYWMGEVEEMMKLSVRNVFKISVDDYLERERTEWVKVHCGMCVLNGSQVHWTSDVERAILEGIDSIKTYYAFLGTQLLDTVALVRQRLTFLQSITLGALIVIDVHAKDVTERLIINNVQSIDDFEWISQLRYYWEEEDVYVKCIQTRFPYGYEYLGNTPRLVITPLTDKCYMTLMGALNLNCGGAPAGPAGTGKTESVKDLSKALAKQVVVFNCSEGMDYIMVGKFFKGLASSGAWACFDEFNRIYIEVLSVIAQQLQQLLEAKRTGQTEIEFESSQIRIQPTFSVFITMNPGYAGRTELPDNLKALFRAVAMMVPDYALIGEIMLYSFGFATARDLAGKMVATFKLSSEQLSSQDHYDYGMRAVRSVINAAGLIKRAEPDMNEEQLLLRALRDVNVPKFLKDDLPLFENIILDLFPGVERPNIDRGMLLPAIKDICEKKNLQAETIFIDKIFQLYDTIQVRHGLMIVGPTGGGKTSNYKVLGAAMSSIKSQPGFNDVFFHILNPKAIKMGQLYGQFDDLTHEWTDGILANMIRNCVKDQHVPPYSNKHWVMFDGPVDALWIENMNTVLDDNKKLCLNSGEIIPLSPHMTMMFEVEDLAVASPATVSRCGMVYMEPSALGLEPLVKSWLGTLPEMVAAKETIPRRLNEFHVTYTYPMIRFVRKHVVEPVVTMDNNLCQSICRILNCFFNNYRGTELKVVQPEEVIELEGMLENLFIYAIIWSLGCTGTIESRRKFNAALHEILETRTLATPFPKEGTVYDWSFDMKTKEYKQWMDTIPSFEADTKLNFSEIVVPTQDSIRIKAAYRLLLSNKYHVLSPGPTGTGKSVNTELLLLKEMPENFQSMTITFSAQTSANQTQALIESKLGRRRNKELGPPLGKYFVIFIDDLNMPKKEKFGAQPPIEILRQWMDHRGWYELKTLSKIEIIDIVFMSAMGPPGGGRSFITNRLLRHFNIITYTNLEASDITMIFTKILSASYRVYAEPVREAVSKLVSSTIDVYNTVEQTLLPTPSKSHYTFNLRDMSHVFQGLVSSSQKVLSTKMTLLRLWAHENLRVFADRLVTKEDIAWLTNLLKEKIKSVFASSPEEVFEKENILFCDFMSPSTSERIYAEVDDNDQLISTVNDYLEGYNERFPKKQMKLILFLDACAHVSRICRILRQPGGNVLLLGVGGSGRQSLSRLATYIMEYEVKQIEVSKNYSISQWRDDVKECLKYAGIKNDPVVFLFVDTQIVYEQMLEDVNNVLNSADIPNVYKVDDIQEIQDVGRPECIKKNLQLTDMNIFGQYLLRVKRNIHVVLAMSPIGDIFRSRLRMFPSLINCCTIDWFHEWPEEALVNVAKGQMTEDDLQLGTQFEALIQMFKLVHKSVERRSKDYLAELRRYNYVTPTSYLELLRLFKSLLSEKRVEVRGMRARLQSGLDQLYKAQQDVAQMKVELEELQPQLEKAQDENKVMMEQIAKDKAEASETAKKVEKEEHEAQEKADEAESLQAQAQTELDQAIPLLEKAVEVLNSIKVADLVQVKSYSKPPGAVRKTMEVACLFFGVPPITKPDPNKPGSRIVDYWDAAKTQILNDPKKLLDKLVNYPKDDITETLIQKLTPYIREDPEFTISAVAGSSSACSAICQWAHAMFNYYFVNQKVIPLKIKLEEVNRELEIVRDTLARARARLKEVMDQVAMLEKRYEDGVKMMENLQERKKDCMVKLERAGKLIGGLGGEQDRWGAEVKFRTNQLELLSGDCLLSAGMIGYVGAFTGQYRVEFEREWRESLQQLGILHTQGVTMRGTLGNPVLMQTWKVASLPSDAVSIENGIIIDKSRRWALMIDPQGQANRFIKNMGKEHDEGIEYCKASDANLIRNIGTAIMNGKWFLMENAGGELDPALEPILLQQVVKEGAGFTIRIGDKSIDFNKSFKFFITTTLPNPHYSPETTVKVTILNFAITPDGLEEQMLGVVVAKERPELEEKKNMLIVQNAKSQKELKDIEDRILTLLQTNANILEEEDLINTLAASKQTSTDIMEKVKEAALTEKEIDEERETYRAVAFRAATLFFSIVDLSSVDNMYQYSLQWFSKLFEMAIEKSAKSNVIADRLKSLNDYFTYSLYENVCRSLFEKHKLQFSFMLTVKILQGNKEIDPAEWRYFLTGPQGTVVIPPNPATWLNDNQWRGMYEEIHGAEQLPVCQGLEKYFITHIDQFRPIFDASNAHEVPLPGPWPEKLNPFQRMIVLKAIRPDKVVAAVIDWITLKLGRPFVESPTFELAKVFGDSTVTTPLICVLSPGSDPISSIFKFAEESGKLKSLDSISLGQGMGERAERFIDDAKGRGGWVLLQNCHLAASWMPELERIVEEFDDSMHREFRLWLTSMPAKEFPVSVLQNGVKMTIEPPQGLRANILLSYANFNDAELDDCKKPEAYRTLLFGLCFFHAIVQDRRKFGPIGWNIPYEFTFEDLDVTRKQLKIFLNYDTEVIPYKVMNILGADVNYGGRVTDDKDIRLIRTILQTYMKAEMFDVGYNFSESGKYHPIAPSKHVEYVEFIKTFSLNPDPEAFGLHQNAEITTAISETRRVLETILSIQPRSSSSAGKSREAMISSITQEIEAKLPPLYDVEEISLKYPTQYEESMNTVLIQEVIRYQRLLEIMKTTLADVQKALLGKVVMSEELEGMSSSLFNNQVPKLWTDRGFLSMKPLSSWFSELLERIEFLTGWINEGTPKIFWVSGFFFPQAFFTGTLQNFARRVKVAIDRLNFDFYLLDDRTVADIKVKPEHGCYVYGLWLEGCKWDNQTHKLGPSNQKELYTPLPIVHFLPKIDRKAPETGIYNCPVYKVLSRAGTLSTTGHSTNFVLFMELPSRETEDVWIKAGVAMFLSLRN